MTRHSQSRVFAYIAKMRFLFVLAAIVGLLSSIAGPAFAAGGETGSVTGRVVDASGAPIAGANVTIASPQGTLKQATAKDGTFQFLGTPVDTYTLSIEAPGFEPLTQPAIGVTGGLANQLGAIRLNKSGPKVISNTTVHSGAASAYVGGQTVPQTTISSSVLGAAQGKAGSTNEVAALLAAPGFQVDKTGGLIIEGSETDQVHYNFDGVDFTDPGFNASANQEFFNGISSIQVIPGAGDPSQGDSGSGVVNLVVKRGTYPPSGLADLEYDTHVDAHQIGFQYGIATKNNSVSDFLSFFKTDDDNHIGAYGYGLLDNNALYTPNSGEAIPSSVHETDFVNNFVVKFGHNQNQSLQLLNLFHTGYNVENNNGMPFLYDNANPGELNIANFYNGAGLGTGLVSQLLTPDNGQAPGATNAANVSSISNSELFKIEYDNTFNPTTYLNLRYFHSDIYSFADPAESEFGEPNGFPLYGQSSGGSRTGTNFELFKQADPHNLLTLSGSFELNRPDFGSQGPVQGVEAIGPNAALFLRPTNPNLPVNGYTMANGTTVGSNPCPVDTVNKTDSNYFAGGCFLQQYFYQQGGTPTVPPLDLESKNIQHIYGVGLRDQIQVTDAFRLDLGARYDYLDNGYGPNLVYNDEATQPVINPGGGTDPASPYYIHNYNFVDQPHFFEPRLGTSYQVTRNDTVGLEYGRSINLEGSGELASPEGDDDFQQFANIPITQNFINAWDNAGILTGAPAVNANPAAGTILCKTGVPFAAGAGPNANPVYNGTIGTTLQLGRECQSVADALKQQEDFYYPEIAAVQPTVIDNTDFNFAHRFKNGMAVKIAPFYRNEYDVQNITAPLVFNPVTNTFQIGSLQSLATGKNQTSGVNFDFTLPDRPYGFTGFFNASYVNEFTNTPAEGDNPNGQDFEPLIPPQFALVNPLFRAGFVSPLTANLGIAYKTKTGFRVNPVLHFNIGYPYNSGSTTADILNVSNAAGASVPTGVIVPNTNFTDYFQTSSGGAPAYVDPANPGSILAPNIAATRGEKETPNGGGLLSTPQVTADLTFEYTPPHSRSTFGVQLLDVFNNEYLGVPVPNPNYYPVVSGVSGPLTGQQPNQSAGLVNRVASGTYPYAAYTIDPIINTANPDANLPTTLRVYYQLAL